MRFVDRGPFARPAVLHAVYRTDGKTELGRATDHYAGQAESEDKSTFEFSRYKHEAVKTALEKIFHGKCAYCESAYGRTQPVDVEHFRPKAKIDGAEGHSGYWWLAMEWTNLLPSCIDCNRRRHQPIVVRGDAPEPGGGEQLPPPSLQLTGKATAFPLLHEADRANPAPDDMDRAVELLSRERPLLLDPCDPRDRPENHLMFPAEPGNPISLVYAKPLAQAGRDPGLLDYQADLGHLVEQARERGVSERGAVSIQVYGLNRLRLVQARTKMIQDLEFLLATAIELGEMALSLDERIEVRDGHLAMMAAAGSETASELREEIAFDRRLLAKLRALQHRIVDRLKQRMEPQAEYSELARNWLSARLDNADLL